MAPMTRNRADNSGMPLAMMRTYYQQRASACLIITESVRMSAEGVAYPFAPGLYSDAQVVGGLRLTDAVPLGG